MSATDATPRPLAPIRADGWLDRLLEGDESLAEIADVVGAPFVAFAFVAGVKITNVDGDTDRPETTLVDFRVGDEQGEQRLGLGEFRRRLAAALLSDEAPLMPPPAAGAADAEVEAFLGPQLLLLAPVFGMRLETLRVERGRVRVDVARAPVEGARGRPADDAPEGTATLAVEELRERIRDAIQAEVERVRDASTLQIDLSVVPRAETALAAGDPRRAITLLGAWPGPLTMLLRTPQGASLEPEVRVVIGRALGLLGSAYVTTSRFEWAEETLRLGIQFVMDGVAAGDLYRRLGECYAAQDRLGEAIGPLRRALGLGIEEAEVLSLLGHAYEDRGRHVAATACAERALSLGVDVDAMEALRDRGAEALGAPWRAFRERFRGPDPDESDAPPTEPR